MPRPKLQEFAPGVLAEVVDEDDCARPPGTLTAEVSVAILVRIGDETKTFDAAGSSGSVVAERVARGLMESTCAEASGWLGDRLHGTE